jgi:hypothetical protein
MWIEPNDKSVVADYRLTRRSIDAAAGYDLGLPDVEVTYRWNGCNAWISGYRDGIQRREAVLVCLHANNGWRIA